MASSVSKQYGFTVVESQHFTYEWKIENFKLLPEKKGQCISSPNFHSKENNKVKWKIDLYPRGGDKDNEKYVSLYLRLNSQDRRFIKIKVHCELSLFKSKKVKSNLSFVYTYRKRIGYGTDKMIERSKLLNSSGSTQTIVIRCTVDIPQETITKPVQPIYFDLQTGQMTEHFSLLLSDSRFSDMTIIVGKEKLTAHKIVLAARSAVFAAMFEHKEMEENRKNELKIEDLEAATVRGMLEFIYTDEVTDLRGLAPELLRASDKYQLDRLRTMCEKVIYETVTHQNAAEILLLSDLYRSQKLKEYVIAFIEVHLLSVMQSSSYKSMVEMYPALNDELMCSITIRKELKA